MTENRIDTYLKDMTFAIDNLGLSAQLIDSSLELMKMYALIHLNLEEQRRVSKAIRLVIDHFRAVIIDAEYSLNPIENSSQEYTR